MFVTLVAAAVSLQAGIVASWDFEEATAGQYGVQLITMTTSSVNNVIAYESGNTDPYYVRGADGIGHGTAVGVLGVPASATADALFSGWEEFSISFDARVSSIPDSTQAILRYGVTQTAWNIFVTSDGHLNMTWYDGSGSFDLNTAGAAFFADSEYHHYEIIWDGYSAQIWVDGVAQLVENGSSTKATVVLGAVRSAGGSGRLGIGGFVRDNGSVSQEFGGFLDNIIISDAAVVPVTVAAWTFPEGIVAAGDVFTNSQDVYTGLLLKKKSNSGSQIYYTTSSTGAGLDFDNYNTGNNDGSFCIADDSPLFTGHGHYHNAPGFRSMAIDCWLKASAYKQCQIVGKWDYNPDDPSKMNGYRLYMNASGRICLEMAGTEGSFLAQTRMIFPLDGEWHRIRANWEEDYGDYNVQIMIDDVIARATGHIGMLYNTTNLFCIGGLYRDSANSGQYVDGGIDNVLISTERSDLLQISGDIDPTPIVPTGAHLTNQPGYIASGFVHNPPYTPTCHAATQVPVSDGGVRAAWMAGTCEGHVDGVIMKSDQSPVSRNFDPPDIVGDGSTSSLPYSSTWNPVLFQRPNGVLYCYYKDGMLGSPGGISGLYKTSTDGGHTWSAPVRMSVLGPSKNKPILLDNGVLLMPGNNQMYMTTNYGDTVTGITIPNPAGYKLMQATVSKVGNSSSNLLALFRTDSGKIAQSKSTDSGSTWSSATLTSLPNNNSGIDSVTTADGKIALIYNHATGTTTAAPRTPLNVAMTPDGGTTWYAAAVLEDQSGEFSYPSIICDTFGKLHVMYTWNRLRMKWVILEPSQFILDNSHKISNGVWP